MPGSPIFRDERKTPPITPAPPSTPKSRSKGATHSSTPSNKSSSSTSVGAPTSYTTCYTTRSAAMMALALGQRTKSPMPSSNPRNAVSSTSSASNTTVATSTSYSSGKATTSSTSAPSTNTFVPASLSSSASSSSSSPPTTAQLNGTGQMGGSGGPMSAGSSASSGSDNDGFNTSSSSSATALRRLYFKSGRKMKMNSTTAATTSMTSIPMSAVTTATTAFHTSMSGGLPAAVVSTASSGVPKVVIMGSSTASMSETNINTSKDSASTMVTNVTHTDTSETCDSLDLGDNSGQSEPLFSSLEEPLLTAIQIDSEHDGNEMELTSCTMYPRPNMNIQDSTESQESCLSILTGEASSTTPLLSSNRRHNGGITAPSSGTACVKDRLPNTAPPPSSGNKHFTFDPPNSPKSARSSEKTRSQFTFKDHQRERACEDSKYIECTTNFTEERQREHSPSKSKYRGPYGGQRSSYYVEYDRDRNEDDEDEEVTENMRSKKSRSRDNSSSVTTSRNRYSTGGVVVASALKTSPKRELSRRSPTSGIINSAPPTMKDANFFSSSKGSKPKQLSPSSQHRKYSSSSSSGGERERDRERERLKDSTMFPFDREALDYERIQRECFAVAENSSSATGTSSESDEPEPCSVYERKHSSTSSLKSGDIFQQYTLLSQHEIQLQQQQQQSGGVVAGPPSRKNSKRIRPNSVIHSTIRENQQYVPQSDAFYPQSSTSPVAVGDYLVHSEPNKFEEIASKFDLIPPKHGSTLNLTTATSTSPNSSNSPTGSMARSGGLTPPPGGMPDMRVDYFTESQMHGRKKSFKSKTAGGALLMNGGPSYPGADNLEDSQRVNGSAGCGSINVTSNPMEAAAVSTLPRATIVVQQPSLSLDNTVETLLIKNEGDFISVEHGKDGVHTLHSHPAGTPGTTNTSSHNNNNNLNNGICNGIGTATMTIAMARKRNSQQLQATSSALTGHQQQQQQQQQQKRDENMRQLLDVTNTLTFEELRDFEMRYGSPHHSRSQSVKTPGSRSSGRPNQLCLPQQRSRVASMPNTGVEEEYYRLRHFSITGKGVVNRGDSLKSRRSRSNNSVASSNSSTEHLTPAQLPAPTSARTSANCSLASSRESSTSNPGSGPYRVLMLGGPAVGKSSLVSQFMTSEYLHAYDTSIGNIRIQIDKPQDDDDSGEKAVSVLLSGEESELIFIDHAYTEMTPDDCLTGYDPHGYCVIYSASDRSSFTVAEHVLQVLWTNQNIAQKAVILVANKADLARSRLVTSEEGKAMATAYDCKFIETSVGINHNVDELLVGLLSQIRLKLENPEKSRDLFRKRSIRKSKRRACSPLSGACLTGGTHPNTPLSGGALNNAISSDVNTPPGSAHSSPRKYRGSRTSTSLKVKGLLGRVWARDSKSKSCENLHVL